MSTHIKCIYCYVGKIKTKKSFFNALTGYEDEIEIETESEKCGVDPLSVFIDEGQPVCKNYTEGKK